jgi:hypothetical protein
MHDIGHELGQVGWRPAAQMPTSTTMLVKPLAESVREIATIRSFNEGKPAGVLRHLDGGSGASVRSLGPHGG